MKKPVLLILILLWPLLSQGQIEYPGKPLSREIKLKKALVQVNFPGFSRAQEEAYVSSLPTGLKSMAFAYPFDTLLNASKDGGWETTADGSRIWRISIASPGALSLNLIFSRFRLPQGASMYLYAPDFETVRGAFNSKDETPSGVLATVPIPGDQIIVELDLPANADFLPDLEISKVSHDFKGFFSSNSTTDCNVDINCPAGAAWQIEKKAVVKFIRGGVWLCSGALINNTRNDGRPLLLTANHTIGLESHAEQSIFFFRFERPTCTSGNGSTQFTLSGSRLLATTGKVDFSLVELNNAPPKEYDPVYAGWDRRVVSYLDTVTCIHHPNGSVKKISRSFHRVVTADFGGGYDTNTHWKISAWDVGTTEPGSSGSPLFNIDHRIVGDLTGGDASCSYNFNDYFEKFSVSWDKYADSTSQLKYWLDPDQTGVSVLNGYDPYSGGKPVANFSFRPDKIQVGRKVYFTEHTTGLPTTWKWTFEGGTPGVSTLQVPAPVKFNLPGVYHITLHISNNLGSDSLQQSITVSDFGAYSISENRVVPERLITLSDKSTGNPVSISWSVLQATPAVYSGTGYELGFISQGEYTVNEVVEYHGFTDTLIHYNQIKVIPDVIAYRSFTFNNVKYDEHRGYSSTANQGYLPGSNNQGVTAYAEEFRNPSDTTFIINGLTIPIGVRSKWAGTYYLPLVIWNAKKQVVMRDSVLVTNYQAGTTFTKWFRSPVNFDTLLYAGFEVRSWDKGTFVSKMATDRGENGPNTAYVIKGTNWQDVGDFAGIHTSLDIGLETSVLMNSYKQEIKIVPNYNDGNFTVDLGNLVFKNVDISIYNIKGQQVVADVTKQANKVEFRIVPAVPGIYLVRLIIDSYQFATKVMIIRH